MTEFQQVVYGADVWRRGSRGRAGPFSEPYHPLIKNMRMLRDGSLVVRPAWFRWGWHAASETFKRLVGFATTDDAVFAPLYHRVGVASNNKAAFILQDTGGTKVFDRSTITSPVTELYTNTTSNGKTTSQFGFGNITQVNRYDIFMQGTFHKAQGVGSLSGSSSRGPLALSAKFIGGGRTWSHVGSVIHQGRAFYWGVEFENVNSTSIRDNRIWYSDPYDYTRFSEDTQFFDVDGEVRGAVSIGPNLIIWTVEGNWFVLQGRGDPSRGVLHSKGKNRIPAIDDQPARFADVALFNSGNFDVVVVIDRDGNPDTEALARFGGSSIQGLITRRSPPASSPLQDVVTVPALELGDAIHLSRGVWVEETWDLTGVTYGDRTVLRSHSEENEEFLAHPVDVGGGAYEYEIYQRDTLTNAPSSYVVGVATSPAETVDGEIHLPRVWNPDFDVRIVQVTIDGRYWKSTGSTVYDTLNMEVNIGDAVSLVDFPCTIGPDTGMIASLPAGVERPVRLVATPTAGALPSTSWSEVKLQAIRSFAIEQVMVEFELSPRRDH